MEYSASQLTYLEHLGIDVWLARPFIEGEIIPVAAQVESRNAAQKNIQQPEGAAPASKIQPAQPHPVQITSVKTNGAASAAPQTLQQALSAPTFPQAAIKPNAAETHMQTPAPTEAVVPHFNIQFWCYSSGLWIVSGELELSANHHMLVHNIAQFVQGKNRKPKHVGIFSWPMLNAPNLDQSSDIASKYLGQHIAQLQALSPCKKVLAFNDCHAWFENMEAVKLPNNISQLLHSVAHKKALWHQLIPHQISI